MNPSVQMSRGLLGIAGRKGILGIGNNTCEGTELLPLSQESISTITWSDSCIIIGVRNFFIFLPRHWPVDKTASFAHESLMGVL